MQSIKSEQKEKKQDSKINTAYDKQQNKLKINEQIQ